MIGLRSWMNMRSMLSLKATIIVISRIVKIIRGITGEKCSETDLKINSFDSFRVSPGLPRIVE